MGVEPSSWAVGAARSNNIPVVEGTIDSSFLDGKQFDVITLWDVIEHLSSPKAEIAKFNAKLKPGGILVVHTMDIDSLAAKVMGTRWPWLMDMHIHYFSRDTLAKLMEDSDFQVMWIGAQGRYLSLGYIASRLGGMSRFMGRISSKMVRILGIQNKTVPVNFGDLITLVARKSAP